MNKPSFHLPPEATPPTSTGDSRLPHWLWLALVITSSISLLGTVHWGIGTQWQQPAATIAEPTTSQLTGAAANAATASLPARTVTLVIDGETRTLTTPLENPAAILAAHNIQLAPVDRIWLDGTLATRDDMAQWPVPVNRIDIRPQMTLTIIDGETRHTIQTEADTVGDALYAAGIAVYLTDTVTPTLATPLTGDTQITINRAVPVIIAVDDTRIETRVQGATVADALAESGIALVGLDYTVPGETEPIQPQMTITVMRITEDIQTYDEQISFETRYQADPQRELDTRQTIQNGQVGIRRYSERVRYQNGIEIAREPEGSEIIQAPQDRIVSYGTKIILRDIQTPQGTRQYWRKFRAYATSYHPQALGGDDVTAIGATLQKGIISADPAIIPYRTQMFVPGYGVGKMADTGGTRSSPYWVDLGYSDADYVGWHEYVDVYLLAPVPTEINYLLPQWSSMRGLPDNQ